MSRARNIKPGFYKNEDLAECSVWARFIFPGLWMLADREGRLEDRSKRIKAELLPFDTQDIEPLLSELAERKFIDRYEVGGIKYIQVVAFKAHQAPHYSEKSSVIPACKTQESIKHQEPQTPGALQEDSGNVVPIKTGSQPPDSLIPDSLIPDSRPEVIEKIPLDDGSLFDVDEGFVAEMQKAYPRVDIIAELGKMRAWTLANTSNRKTRRGLPRFINSWLSRAGAPGATAAAAQAPMRVRRELGT